MGLLAGTAFAVGAKQQVRELALLASSGAESPTIRAVVTAGGLWLGGIAVASGAAMGLGAAAVVVHLARLTGSVQLAGLHPDVPLSSAAMAMGLAACILAAMVPARQVSRQAVLGALKSGRAPAPATSRSTVAGAVMLLAAAGLLVAGWSLGTSTADPDQRAGELPLVVSALILGAVLAVAGLVMVTGWLVRRMTSRTRWMSLSLRMAARDSARNLGRSVPAVAAVLAAAALASAALVLSASQQAGLRQSHWWGGLENQASLPLVVDPGAPSGGSRRQSPVHVDPSVLSSAVADALDTVEWTHPITAPESIRTCAEGPADPTLPARTSSSNCLLYSLATPEANGCPRTPQGRLKDPGDWRCRGSMALQSPFEGTVMVGGEADIRAVLGRDATPDALAVLNAGGMVVTNPVFVSDGHVLLQAQDVRTHEPAVSGPGTVPITVSSTSLAAAVLEPVVPVPYYGVVSPETAERLQMHPERAALLVQLARYPSAAEADTASAAAAAVYGQPGMTFRAEPGVSQHRLWVTWSIVAASALITFSAAGITTGLSMADARKDHATLAAVGASPRLRKALAGSQALFTSGIGAVLGTLAGTVPAVVLALSTDMRTAVEIPWLHLSALVAAVPVTGAALAWAFTRAGLPLSRRTQG